MCNAITHSLIQLSFASALGDYLKRVQDLGAVEGQHGAVELNPTLQPVLEATTRPTADPATSRSST